MNAVTDRRALQLPLDRFDVSDPGLYQAQTYHAYFDRLRREDPLHWCADSRFGPYWSITRYKDIMATEVNHQVFSSELGGIQVIDQPKDMTRPSFIRMDPPKHDEQRKVVQPIVAPGNLANMEPLIRERTQKVLDGLPRNVEFDWVEHVSIELTTLMLATLFDFPVEQRNKLTYWSDVAIADITDPEAPVRTEEARFAELKVMAETMAGLFNARKDAPPGFDLLSMLAHGAATRDMPFREFMGNLGLLIVGGNDTTRNSMSGGLLALSQNPAEWDKLRADPGLIPNMVSEMIRWVTPVIHMRRTASRDFELHGKTIRAGDKVVMWYVSGNRDPEAIEEPDRFIIDRPKARQHLSFGFGVHRCVGNRLAELQLRILWEEVVARFPRIEVLGEAKRTYSNFIHGIRSLPVRDSGLMERQLALPGKLGPMVARFLRRMSQGRLGWLVPLARRTGGGQFHFVADYERVVAQMSARYPVEEAMARAVGTTPEAFRQTGRTELAALRQAGLRPGAMVFDLGCGSGRLAAALAESGMSVEYLGTDVVAALLDYARGHAPAHFSFRLHPALSVPLPDASVDIACAFSVFTHLLHAETYIYLEEMRRVLRPGGRVIFSFLEFASPAHWDVFQATVAGQRATQTPHLNQFIERSSIETWARHLGFAVERFIDAGAEVEPGAGALGQSMVILRASG